MRLVRKRRRAKKDERGFALLLVFLLASAVALTLYRQMPREAFESERDKEQMLIDRGEQYKRAIYMYYMGNNRQWPAKIEDLENTNNHRYLRHRYVDPYTGKEEWRLIHTNGTFLTDSLVKPPPAQATPGSSPGSTSATAGTGAGAGGAGTPTTGTGGAGTPTTGTLPSAMTVTDINAPDPNAPPEVNAQVARRPSDRTLAANSNFQNPTGGSTASGTDPGSQPFNPSTLPPISLYPNGYNAPPVNMPGVNGQGLPGATQLGVNQPGVNPPGGVTPPGLTPPGVPGFNIPGTSSPVTTPGVNPPNFNQQGVNQPGLSGAQLPTQQFQQQFQQQSQLQQQNQPNVAGNVQGFGAAPVGAQQQGAPGTLSTQGAAGAASSNQAVNLINQLLTTPRQPPAGVGQQPQTGGGLAGVASTYKGATIKSYADRKKYQEWEFVFQLPTTTTLQAPQTAGANGQNPAGGPAGGTGIQGAPGAAPGSTTPGSTLPGNMFPGSTAAPGNTTPGSSAPFGTSPGNTNTGAPGGGFGTN
jgi:hypothetical protein